LVGLVWFGSVRFIFRRGGIDFDFEGDEKVEHWLRSEEKDVFIDV